MCCQISTGFLLELNLENMRLCCYTWRLSMLSSKDFLSVSSNMTHIIWVILYDSFMNKKPFPWHCFWFHISYNRKLDRILFENPSKILPIFLIIFQEFESLCMYMFQAKIKIQATQGAKKYHKILVCNFQ